MESNSSGVAGILLRAKSRAVDQVCSLPPVAPKITDGSVIAVFAGLPGLHLHRALCDPRDRLPIECCRLIKLCDRYCTGQGARLLHPHTRTGTDLALLVLYGREGNHPQPFIVFRPFCQFLTWPYCEFPGLILEGRGGVLGGGEARIGTPLGGVAGYKDRSFPDGFACYGLCKALIAAWRMFPI